MQGIKNTYDSEVALLHLIWTGQVGKSLVDTLPEEYFRSPGMANILKIAKEILAQGLTLDLTLANEKLTDTEFATVMLNPDPERVRPSNFMPYAIFLADEYSKRKILGIIETCQGKPTYEDIENIRNLSINPLRKSVPLVKYLDAYQEVIHEGLSEDRRPAIPSGFKRLDAAIVGFRKGELTTLGARPGQGKTSVMCQIAANVATAGHKVLFFSTEMQAKDILAGRFIPIQTNIPAWKFRLRVLNDEKERLMGQHFEQAGKLNIAICDNPMPTLSDIIEATIANRPEIVIIDYLQRCSMPHADTRRIEVLKLVMALKSLAVKEDVPMVIGSQLGRGVDRNDEPMLSDLMESSSIESESDIVILFNEDKAVFRRNPEKLNDYLKSPYKRIKVKIEKNRHGQTKILYFSLNKATTEVKEIEQTETANTADTLESVTL